MMLPSDLSQEAIDRLPHSARELLIIGGINAAVVLVNNFGGRRITISKNSRLYDDLVVMLGTEAFNAYEKYYGSESINIPLCNTVKKWLASQSLLDDIKGSESNAKLAGKHGCSERWIYKLKKRMKTAA